MWKDIWSPMFVAVLFTVANKWKQQKDPVSDEWTNKMWCVYQFSLVHSLCHVRLFVTPWTAAHQASLSLTIPQSLPKLVFIASVMPSCSQIIHKNSSE